MGAVCSMKESSLPQNQRVQKVISQRSAGECTCCTRANTFPIRYSKKKSRWPRLKIEGGDIKKWKQKREYEKQGMNSEYYSFFIIFLVGTRPSSWHQCNSPHMYSDGKARKEFLYYK